MLSALSLLFFFNDTATTEIYTLSLHDALPISRADLGPGRRRPGRSGDPVGARPRRAVAGGVVRSEEHTSELQSQSNLVCRLLLEKKKKKRETNVRSKDTLYILRVYSRQNTYRL